MAGREDSQVRAMRNRSRESGSRFHDFLRAILRPALNQSDHLIPTIPSSHLAILESNFVLSIAPNPPQLKSLDHARQ